MATRKKLVLFVEGDGDVKAVPVLVHRLITEANAWDCIDLDTNPFRLGKLADITGSKAKNWTDKLKAAAKRKNLGAVLLLLDGDIEQIEKRKFCPVECARTLAERARVAGAGAVFSVAVVFALQEYESWLLACSDRLAGQPLPGNRQGLREDAAPPEGDLEKHPRDAKKWLAKQMPAGYKPTEHQESLTQLMVRHLDALRQRPMRAFLRLEKAVRELAEAIRSGRHRATPEPPPA
jgi:hypothetical protein